MSGQLSLDFSESAMQRHRRAAKNVADQVQPTLFSAWSPNIDIHLHSPIEAVATISGADPERAHHWLMGVVGSIRVIKTRRVAFDIEKLDRLLWLRPPAQVTLDAATAAVAKALWANSLGLRPLVVSRDGNRLIARSNRWPVGLGVKDVPWTAISALVQTGIELKVETSAETLFERRLRESGASIGSASLGGSAVLIQTSRPEIVERLGLPGLAYDGEPSSGRYKMPLLASEPLLTQALIYVPEELASQIRKATGVAKKLEPKAGFPWTLFPFQSVDAGKAMRILQTTGGVLLAGDMGSGKTTVSLALVHELDLWPLLVVAPLSAFSTWDRQLKEMNRSSYLATESPAKSWEQIESGQYDAVVVSYDRLAAFAELIERQHYKSAIADEVQRVRTPGSRRSRALRSLASAIPFRIGLSGTPLVNGLSDLLPLGAWVAPGEWKPRASDKELSDVYPGEPTESVADHLGALMVRRRMEDVPTRLPKRNDHRVFVQLTREQRKALNDLEEEAKAAKEAGEFDEPGSKIHAFARLQQMRKIVNNPSSAGVPGPNPKVRAAIDVASDFLAMGRKGVIFTADRESFREIGRELDALGIGWVGIWGSTPPQDRIRNEKKFHADPECKVVVCTIQAGSESWSASPTATWLITTSYVYAPATLDQMAARVYRMNSDPDGPDIEVMYVHAQMAGGSLDDRMLEILDIKRQMFAQVVDRQAFVDNTNVHYSMSDLLYLMTGERNETRTLVEADEKRVMAEDERRKEHAKRSLYKNKGKNKELVTDDGEWALTLEEWEESETEPGADEFAVFDDDDAEAESEE